MVQSSSSLVSSLLTPKRTFGENGGRGKTYCIPLCNGSFYDRNGKRTGIAFFFFTLKKKQEVAAIRRKEKKGVFEITDATKVCSLHFHTEHAKVAINSNRKSKGEGADPSVLPWTDEEKKGTRTPPTRRLLSVFTPNRSADENSLAEQMDIDISMDSIVDEMILQQ